MDDIVTIDTLKPLERNARTRGPRAKDTLRESLQRFGAARSIVVDEDGTVLAGNGTVEAARETGINRVLVVDTDGATLVAVRRRGLTEEQKRLLALYDNRTSELAEWDTAALKELCEIEELDLSALWREDELAVLLAEAPEVQPIEEVEVPRIDQPKTVVCPNCGHEFRP